MSFQKIQKEYSSLSIGRFFLTQDALGYSSSVTQNSMHTLSSAFVFFFGETMYRVRWYLIWDIQKACDQHVFMMQSKSNLFLWHKLAIANIGNLPEPRVSQLLMNRHTIRINMIVFFNVFSLGTTDEIKTSRKPNLWRLSNEGCVFLDFGTAL